MPLAQTSRLWDAARVLTPRRMRTPPVQRHGVAWRVANVALFILAMAAALAVIFGVMVGMWLLASHGI